jgi:hypothetical protein
VRGAIAVPSPDHDASSPQFHDRPQQRRARRRLICKIACQTTSRSFVLIILLRRRAASAARVKTPATHDGLMPRIKYAVRTIQTETRTITDTLDFFPALVRSETKLRSPRLSTQRTHPIPFDSKTNSERNPKFQHDGSAYHSILADS